MVTRARAQRIQRHQRAPYCSQTAQLKAFGIWKWCSLKPVFNVYANLPRAAYELHNLKLVKSDMNADRLSLYMYIATTETDTSKVYKNIKRHTAHTIVSWPTPKQWVIIHTCTSDLMMIIGQIIYSLNHHIRRRVNWNQRAPYIV